jgi:hypothetical protein
MEWVLLALFLGWSGQCASQKRQREWEKAERRRAYEEQKEFEQFIASLEGLSPEAKEAAWKQRGQCIALAAQCAAVAACSFGIF